MKASKGSKRPAGRCKESGFSLVELMIAIALLSIGILTMMTMQVNSIRTNSSARRITQSAAIGADRFEKLIGLPYTDDLLAPESEHTLVDGRYTIEWRVSPDHYPIENVKTIRVTVTTQEAGQQRSISYVYYKADKI
jgi:prepilin-type N-terminal cleavage/methylation domain-containing protein